MCSLGEHPHMRGCRPSRGFPPNQPKAELARSWSRSWRGMGAGRQGQGEQARHERQRGAMELKKFLKSTEIHTHPSAPPPPTAKGCVCSPTITACTNSSRPPSIPTPSWAASIAWAGAGAFAHRNLDGARCFLMASLFCFTRTLPMRRRRDSPTTIWRILPLGFRSPKRRPPAK